MWSKGVNPIYKFLLFTLKITFAFLGPSSTYTTPTTASTYTTPKTTYTTPKTTYTTPKTTYTTPKTTYTYTTPTTAYTYTTPSTAYTNTKPTTDYTYTKPTDYTYPTPKTTTENTLVDPKCILGGKIICWLPCLKHNFLPKVSCSFFLLKTINCKCSLFGKAVRDFQMSVSDEKTIGHLPNFK